MLAPPQPGSLHDSCAFAHEDRSWHLQQAPCTGCAAAHGDRRWHLHTPCTYCAAYHGTDAGTSTTPCNIIAASMRTRFPNIFRLLCYFRHELERVWGSSLRCNFNTFFHWLEIELGRVLILHSFYNLVWGPWRLTSELRGLPENLHASAPHADRASYLGDLCQYQAYSTTATLYIVVYNRFKCTFMNPHRRVPIGSWCMLFEVLGK